MATINISSSIPFINFFKSNNPNGLTAQQVRDAVLGAMNINKSFDIIDFALTTDPFVGFGSTEYTNKTIRASVIAYETADETVIVPIGEISDTIQIYFVDDVSAPLDNTPPVITPISTSEIVINAGDFSFTTTFINYFFTITDPQSGVSDFGLTPTPDWAFPRARAAVDVFAINGDGFTSFFTFFLTILPPDNIAPTLTLQTTILQFNKSVYPTGVSPTILTNAMLSIATASDNLDPNPTFEFDKNRVQLNDNVNQATYQIRAVDNSGNRSAYQSISVFYIDDINVGDTEPPLLSLLTNVFNFNVSQFPSGVTANQITTLVAQSIIASDNSGSFAIQYNPTIQNITIVPGVGLTDSYAYQVRAIDGDGNTSPYVSFTVNYVNNTAPADITAPIINGSSTQTFLVSDNRTIGYLLTLYTITDSTQPVSFYNMDTSFVFNTVGTFTVTLQAIDGVGNIGTRNITVNVVATLPPPDTTPPTITGANTVTIYVQDTLNTDAFLSLYYAINDLSGISSKTLNPSVNFNLAGTYQTTIFAIDNFSNVATKDITIIILEGANPNIPEQQGNTTLENIYIGDELITNKVKLGFTLSDKIDVELDSATIVMPYTTKQEPYRPFTEVKFYFSNKVQPITYYVSDDTVTRLSASQNFFQHSLVLIEPTKILERFKCVDMTFTQPIDSSFAPYTLLDVVNRISFNNPVKKFNETTSYWDSVDSTLSNLLASIQAPQLQFRSMTIREALDRTFQYINAVARLKILDNGTKVLNADFFNTQDTLIALENSINITRSQGSEFFAENSELTVENATTEYASVKFPSYGWAGVRSSSSLVDSNNIHIEVPFPIYEILSIKLFARITAFSGAAGDTLYLETDITPYVLEKQLYDALPVGTLARHNNKEKHTFNNLYFSRGDNKIYNISQIADLSPLGFANNSRVIDLIFDTIYGGDNFSAKWSPVKFSDLLFRVEYRTLLSSRLRFMRDVKEDFFGTIHTNQMENLLDLEGLGANARGVINRVGNPDLTATKILKNWEQRFKVGQFTEDGFIATDVENAVFNDHIRSTASFTKNYNGLSKFVGVDTEVRQIPIPLQTTKSLVHYDQFTIIDTQPITSNGTHFAQNLMLNQFGDYLKQIDDKTFTDNLNVSATLYTFGSYFTIPDNFGIVEVLLNGNIVTAGLPVYIYIFPEPEDEVGPFQPIYTNSSTSATYTNSPITVNLQPGQRYRLSLQTLRSTLDASRVSITIRYITPYSFDKYMVKFISYNDVGQQIAKVAVAPDISSINNSFKLDFYFNDNLSAGYSIDRNITGAGQLLTGQNKVLYTDTIGRFGLYEFSLAKMVTPTTDEAKITVAERMPSALDGDFYDSILVSPIMKHKKDNTENFGLTYQSHFLVGDNSQGHIVIGKKFLTKWFKSDNLNDITFKLYVSTNETYTKFENDKVKGTMLSSNDAYTVTTLTSTQQIRIDILADVSNAKSFAIGTANGDLVLGFNKTHPTTGAIKDMTTIYLNFTDKRS